MEFIVKDLMINVLPLRPGSYRGCPMQTCDAGYPTYELERDPIAGCDAGCSACTPCTPCSGCSPITTTTGCCGHATMVTGEYRLAQSSVWDLALLKQQLREALAAVEAREQVVHQAMRPKSGPEIEMLQRQLEAALEALKNMPTESESQEPVGYQEPGSQETEE